MEDRKADVLIQEMDLSDVSFQKMITGANTQGQPAACLLVRMGPVDESDRVRNIEYEAGPVYFTSKDFGELYLVDLKFPENATQQFRHTLEMLDQFVNSIDKTTGEYDPERILSFVFTENSDFHSGILSCPLPLFYAQTSSEFMGRCDTLRIAFSRSVIFELLYDRSEEDDFAVEGADLADTEESDGFW